MTSLYVNHELHLSKVRQLALTLSDAGFCELQKRMGVGGGGFLVPHPNFCSRAAVMFRLVQ